MKRIILILTLISFLSSFKGEPSKVLLFVQDNSADLGFMLANEVGQMKKILEQSGYAVDIATNSGEVLNTGSLVIKPDLRLSDVKFKNYSGFIIPCMAANDTIVTREEKAFVKTLLMEGKPVAAQNSAVLMLAKAGALNGKKYAFMETKEQNPPLFPELKSGIYSGIGVIRDGNIITSGNCPMMAKMNGKADGTAELTHTLILAMEQKTK